MSLGVNLLLVAGDRFEAGDGGEGPGRLRHRPQGWISALPVSFTITLTVTINVLIPNKAPGSTIQHH